MTVAKCNTLLPTAALLASAAFGLAPSAQAAPIDVRYVVLKNGQNICDILDEQGVGKAILVRLGKAIVDLYPVTMREAGQAIGSSVAEYCPWHRRDVLAIVEASS